MYLDRSEYLPGLVRDRPFVSRDGLCRLVSSRDEFLVARLVSARKFAGSLHLYLGMSERTADPESVRFVRDGSTNSDSVTLALKKERCDRVF